MPHITSCTAAVRSSSPHLKGDPPAPRRMRFSIRRLALTLLLLIVSTGIVGAAPVLERKPSETAVPGLTYGTVEELPRPKTIFFGAGIDDILADAEEWKRRGIDAFFVDYVAREWSTDIWSTDGKPWTIGESDETLQKARKAAEICRGIGSETFLKIAFDNTFDWFDDILWQKADHNFRQFAIFAREAGFDGLALDIEYIGRQYVFDWEGYTYEGYNRKDLVRKIEDRMTRVWGILHDEFPDMTFLTFPEQGLGLGAHVHRAWIEEAARRNASGGIHYCTEYTYRNCNINYQFGHVWNCHNLFHKILSERAWKYWIEKCSIAAGLWPFSSDDYRLFGPGIPYAELKQGLASTLMLSPRYNWIYGSYTQKQLIGRELEKYDGPEDVQAHLAALAQREMVADAKWVNLAKELRQGVLRDYSAELGVLPMPLLVGPDDDPRVELVPTRGPFADINHPEYQKAWEIGLRLFEGEEIDLRREYGTIVDWNLIGPFSSDAAFSGHATVYPPEKSFDLDAEYEGHEGARVKWFEHRGEGTFTSVDLREAVKPSENVCAYALAYVTSPSEQKVQLRIGTNDMGKMWIDGELVFDHPHDGRALLDREVIPFTLPKGTVPILIKVTNGRLDWGFVFRITDGEGRPVEGLEFTLGR